MLLREWLIGEGRNDQVMDLLNAQANDFTAEAHVSRSIAALLAGDLRQAERECRTALHMEPRSATAHNHLGRALHNLGHGEHALQAFQAATQLLPDYTQAWYNLGHALRAQGRMPEAVSAFLGVTPTDGMMDLKKRLDARDRVRTNSYQQVAEPVYQRSVKRWKNYEEYLAPVLPVLEPYIRRFGFDT